MAYSARYYQQFVIALLLLSGCTAPPATLGQADKNDGRTEWTKDGKEKIRQERMQLALEHEQWIKRTSDTIPASYQPDGQPHFIVVNTQCGTGINNHVHQGFWPYAVTRIFNTKEDAKKYIDRYCEPQGCVLLWGIEQS